MRRLAQSSGGDLRDYFRMLRLAVTNLPRVGRAEMERVLASAERAGRMLASLPTRWPVRGGVNSDDDVIDGGPGRDVLRGGDGADRPQREEYESFLDRSTHDSSSKVQLLAIDTVLGGDSAGERQR